MHLTVLALGGNALVDPELPPTVENQIAVTERAVEPIADLVHAGESLVITHGNGPQVGFMALRSALSRSQVHEVPLDALVADTQGAIGYMLQRALREALIRRGVPAEVVTVVTEVEVDPRDRAFGAPTKPIGQFYTEAEAQVLADERGWVLHEYAHRGWRRVVPSPRPWRIVQVGTIRRLVASGVVVVCCGGGGIPVVRGTDGALRGVEGVIDKDWTSALLARRLDAEGLVISTGVDRIYRDFGTDRATPIDRITASELRALAARDQFPAGSMGPKVQAALSYLRNGGHSVTICHPDALARAVRGEAGTRIEESP